MNTDLCVSEEGEEQLQLLHQHVGAAELERQDVSPETEMQRVAVNPFPPFKFIAYVYN